MDNITHSTIARCIYKLNIFKEHVVFPFVHGKVVTNILWHGYISLTLPFTKLNLYFFWNARRPQKELTMGTRIVHDKIAESEITTF